MTAKAELWNRINEITAEIATAEAEVVEVSKALSVELSWTPPASNKIDIAALRAKSPAFRTGSALEVELEEKKVALAERLQQLRTEARSIYAQIKTL